MDDIDSLTKFLKKSEVWFKYEILDLLRAKTLQALHIDFAELRKMTTEELLKIPYEDNGEISEKFPKFAAFIKECNEMSIMNTPPAALPERAIPSELFHKVKEKKAYELSQIMPLILTELEKAKVETVIDIGCGVGNMLRILNHFGYYTIGIESDHLYAELARNNNPKSDIIETHLDNDNIFDLLVNLQHNRDTPTAIISLHGCGDLQSTILTLFTSVDRVDFPVLVTVGCCYNKRNSAEILSEAVAKSLNDNELHISPSAMRLAGDRGLQFWKDQPKETLEFHANCMFKRAMIHLCFSDRKNYRNYRGRIGDLPDDPALFAQTMLLDYEGQHNGRLTSSQQHDLTQKVQAYQPCKPWIQRLAIMQAALQGPLESLLQLDAYHYLLENGRPTARLVPVFDATRSPRNMAIVYNAAD
uniref:Methyltranfer_dom domain-containing protein n=1 Tax=Panagrellus redivivus TaxID=6233 RepID=A0A7E4W0V9_PANRE